MTVFLDPEGAEISALREVVDFTGRRVLEVGCGDGRLTWRYAEEAAHVTAIDPDPEGIRAAIKICPRNLRSRVEFRTTSLQDYSPSGDAPPFDIALLSWSL